MKIGKLNFYALTDYESQIEAEYELGRRSRSGCVAHIGSHIIYNIFTFFGKLDIVLRLC